MAEATRANGGCHRGSGSCGIGSCRNPTVGCRSDEQSKGNSFVVEFDRASDAAGCVLDLQRAPFASIELCIDPYTGEVRLRD